jgi:hypothetical protein
MMRLRLRKQLLCVLAIAGLLFFLGRVYTHTQRDDVREAAIRFCVQRHPQIYFVGSGDQDPDDKFLSRFSDIKKLVRPMSQSVYDRKDKHIVRTYFDRTTGEVGELLYLSDDVEWQGPLKAELNVGTSQRGSKLFLEKNFSGWRVVQNNDTYAD